MELTHCTIYSIPCFWSRTHHYKSSHCVMNFEQHLLRPYQLFYPERTLSSELYFYTCTYPSVEFINISNSPSARRSEGFYGVFPQANYTFAWRTIVCSGFFCWIAAVVLNTFGASSSVIRIILSQNMAHLKSWGVCHPRKSLHDRHASSSIGRR